MKSSLPDVFTLNVLGNPTMGIPARLVPIFKKDGSQNYYVQISDDLGEKVLKFDQVNIGSFRSLHKTKESIRSWKGSKIVQSAKIDEDSTIIESSRACFIAALKHEVEEKSDLISLENPFFGLEVARFLGDPKLEDHFAYGCALRLGRQSLSIAQSWLSFAPISTSAAASAAKALSQVAEPSSTEPVDQPIVTDEEFPFGLSPGGRPITYTGKVVSLGVWRAMDDAEKLGPKYVRPSRNT